MGIGAGELEICMIYTKAKNLYPAFWMKFRDAFTPFTGEDVPTGHFWKVTNGESGMWFAFVVTMNQGARLEFYVDSGDEDANATVFNLLRASRSEIERIVGSSLEFHEESEGVKRRRVDLPVETSGIADDAEWNNVISQFCSKMPLFEKAVGMFVHH